MPRLSTLVVADFINYSAGNGFNLNIGIAGAQNKNVADG
jgi:hypothetical protein